jgi:predicted RecA/RadA family phage recombinase
MKNAIGDGAAVDLAAPYDVASGDGVLSESLFGVAFADALTGEPLEIAPVGIFSLAKVSAQAWAFGAVIYWDNAARLATTTATANTRIGYAAAAAVNPSAACAVLLAPGGA